MGYPEYPKNRIKVKTDKLGWIDLTEKFKMVLLDGYTLEPPTPKVYTVDIPGGNGVVDLTEALNGDVVFNNRRQEFTFAIINVEEYEKVKTDICNLIHGKRLQYVLSMDKDYYYIGKFKITSIDHTMYTNGKVGFIKLEIDTDPFKSKLSPIVKRINAKVGQLLNLESGRFNIRPVIAAGLKCVVIYTYKGEKKKATINAGVTKTIDDLILTYGDNEVYFRTGKLQNITWKKLKDDNTTFGQFRLWPFYEWGRVEDPTAPADVVITYEWKDL